jgi:hypothetical protein
MIEDGGTLTLMTRAEALTTLARKAWVVGASFIEEYVSNGIDAACEETLLRSQSREVRTFTFVKRWMS